MEFPSLHMRQMNSSGIACAWPLSAAISVLGLVIARSAVVSYLLFDDLRATGQEFWRSWRIVGILEARGPPVII